MIGQAEIEDVGIASVFALQTDLVGFAATGGKVFGDERGRVRSAECRDRIGLIGPPIVNDGLYAGAHANRHHLKLRQFGAQRDVDRERLNVNLAPIELRQIAARVHRAGENLRDGGRSRGVDAGRQPHCQHTEYDKYSTDDEPLGPKAAGGARRVCRVDKVGAVMAHSAYR